MTLIFFISIVQVITYDQLVITDPTGDVILSYPPEGWALPDNRDDIDITNFSVGFNGVATIRIEFKINYMSLGSSGETYETYVLISSSTSNYIYRIGTSTNFIITTHYVYRDDGAFWSGSFWNTSGATWTTYDLISIIWIQNGMIYINYSSISDIPHNNSNYEIHAVYWNSTNTNSYRWGDTAKNQSTTTTSIGIPGFYLSLILIGIGITMIYSLYRKRLI